MKATVANIADRRPKNEAADLLNVAFGMETDITAVCSFARALAMMAVSLDGRDSDALHAVANAISDHASEITRRHGILVHGLAANRASQVG